MKTSTLIKTWMLLLAWSVSTPSLADPSTDAIGKCFAVSISNKDRIDLARWIFASMTLHPEVKSSSVMTPEKREFINRTTAELFNRLLTVDCKGQVRAAVKLGGGQAPLQRAFGLLGRMALNELMAHPSVTGGFSEFEKYVDTNKLKKALN